MLETLAQPVAQSMAADLRIETTAIAELKPYKRNARTHSTKQILQIAKSIQRFGFTNPILVDDEEQIIAGHGRLEAAKLLGITAVPTIKLSHLSPVEKRAYVIADNKLAEKAGWDREILAVELQALVDLDFEIELTGFELDEIAPVADHSEKGKPETQCAAPKRKPRQSSRLVVSRPGDVWLLGDHRLVCGEGDMADADAILQQWEVQTGKQAILKATGQTKSDVMAQRTPSALTPGGSSPSHTPAVAEVQ